MVRDLREKTGAGMMDCKKALTEAGGDMETAVDWLRKKGFAAAAKKSGRTAAEGLIGVTSATKKACDGRGECRDRLRGAQRAVPGVWSRVIAKVALEVGDDHRDDQGDQIPWQRAHGRRRDHASRCDDRREHVAAPGETRDDGQARASWRRTCTARCGRVSARSACLVAIEGTGSEIEVLETLGRQVGDACCGDPAGRARHQRPSTPSALEREKAVLTEQARASGKPDAIIEKMVTGRIQKYYEEVVLLEQVWVHDGESRVKAVVKKARRRGWPASSGSRLARASRRTTGDFAAEVAAATKGQ